MDLSAGKTYQVFKNGPVYRNRHEAEENVIDFSSFRQFQSRFSSRSFSVKYVQSGTEMYSVNGRKYAVGKGQYLLTNAFTQGEIVIDSDEYVRGTCMELSPALLGEVAAIYHEPGSPYPQKDFYNFLTSADFFEHSYNAGKTKLGKYLQHVVPELSGRKFSDELETGEFFYNIAERVIADQCELYKYIRSFTSVKNSTKKDLLCRLLKGKELMDDCYTSKISISEIAVAATMSEYYFFRLFKKVFNCSPHQYLINKRLQKAVVLLRTGGETIGSIAYDCGFSDIHTFNKTFKKRFGRSPGDERRYCSR